MSSASSGINPAIQVGETLPEFRLSDAVGNERSSAELLAHGPLLITFYRGEWCLFCNIALVGFQKIVDEIIHGQMSTRRVLGR
ncbi:hypothetical protein V1523DRAFT_429655, partial [Lipomyces doorenjongii]